MVNFSYYLEKLQYMKNFGGRVQTVGLDNNYVMRFLEIDSKLAEAIDLAYEEHKKLQQEFTSILSMDEDQQCAILQEGILNFYDKEVYSPYVAIAAKGPWIITTKGAVIHDSGGYGMLGFGHNPKQILPVLSNNHVMANVMTPSFMQKRFVELMRKEIGHRYAGAKPVYAKFVCLNSGSEAVTVAFRFVDLHTKIQTEPNARHHGKKTKFISLKGSFHGRTEKPSQISDSCLDKYKQYLASFQNLDNLCLVTPNDCDGLRRVFDEAKEQNVFYEAMFMEPVMGEGNPGEAITPEFYNLARKLTLEHGSLLVVDSVQAGLRAQGCLSIVDYPGFENVVPPDIETYSKAINSGQYPLSVAALSSRVADLYVPSIYGNTMTTNPKALEVACHVLSSITPELRNNIVEKGEELVMKLKNVQQDFPDIVTDVKGCGLLCSISFREDNPKYKVVAPLGIERRMRINGIGVIHGGENALRFTPHFGISSQEIDLIIQVLKKVLKELDKSF